MGKCGKSLSLKSIFSGKWATGNENDRDHLEALCPCFLSRLFSSVESSWTKSKGGGQVTWLGALIMSVKTQFPFACPFCIFSLQRPFTETLSLPAFKGTCHRGSQPGRRKVGKIKNPSWHEMLCEMCLTIKLLMTIAIKNLLFQMQFSVSRPERSCTLKLSMVGCLCD